MGDTRKRVLVSNDDGIDAPGVNTLVEELLRLGDFLDVRVACPASQQSAKSHCITLYHPLTVEEYTMPAVPSVRAVKCEGSPADCIKICLQSSLWEGWRPDLVVSGINHGCNTGIDLLYSGTYAAATEATLYEVPAIALSLFTDLGGFPDFSRAAEHAAKLVHWVLSDASRLNSLRHCTMNVNFPNSETIHGWKFTRQGSSKYSDYYELQHEEPASEPHLRRMRFRLRGKLQPGNEPDDVDVIAVRDGWISVSVLGLHFSVSDSMSKLASEAVSDLQRSLENHA